MNKRLKYKLLDNILWVISMFKPKALYCENNIEISYIKKAFKNTIVSMYILISFLRKKVNWLKQYSMNMDDVFNSDELAKLLGVEYIESLKNSFIKITFSKKFVYLYK